MSRYIDADDVLTQRIGKEFNNTYEQGKVQGWNDAIDYIGNFAPTADVRPNVHGEWLHKDGIYGVVFCSECDYELHINNTNFCPNCGALMSEILKSYDIGNSFIDGLKAGMKAGMKGETNGRSDQKAECD